MTKLDLATLREIAEWATEGPWRIYTVTDSGGRSAAVETAWAHDEHGEDTELVTDWCSPEDAAHIAAFDPPTALALVARAVAAEAKIAAVRELHRPVPVYTTEAGDCEHGDDCKSVEISAGSYCPVHTDGLTCDSCAAIGEDLSAGELPAYPCPTIAALDGTA